MDKQHEVQLASDAMRAQIRLSSSTWHPCTRLPTLTATTVLLALCGKHDPTCMPVQHRHECGGVAALASARFLHTRAVGLSELQSRRASGACARVNMGNTTKCSGTHRLVPNGCSPLQTCHASSTPAWDTPPHPCLLPGPAQRHVSRYLSKLPGHCAYRLCRHGAGLATVVAWRRGSALTDIWSTSISAKTTWLNCGRRATSAT